MATVRQRGKRTEKVTGKMPYEYRGWSIGAPNLNEEPPGVWWVNGSIKEIATGESEPVALSQHERSRDDALRAFFAAARQRIAAKG
jgi:hypothetical protein